MKKSKLICLLSFVLMLCLAVTLLVGCQEAVATQLIATNPTKTAYTVGETFDASGMTVSVKYSDGSEKTVTNFTYSPTDSLGLSDTTVTIYWTEGDISLSTTVAIAVSSKAVTSLSAPNVIINGDVISWATVQNATNYEVYVDGELKATVTQTNYTLDIEQEGVYEITVKATLGGGADKISSSASNAVSYIKVTTLPAPLVTLESNVVSWQAVEGADGYEVFVNDQSKGVQQTLSYTLLDAEIGVYNIKVVAKDSTGKLNASANSNVVSVTIRPDLTAPITLAIGDKAIALHQDGYLVATGTEGASFIVESTSNGYTIRNTQGMYLIYVPTSAVMANRSWVFADKLESDNNAFYWDITPIENDADGYYISSKALVDNRIMSDEGKVIVQQMSTSTLPASASVITITASSLSASDFTAGQVATDMAFDFSKPVTMQYNSLIADNQYLALVEQTVEYARSTLSNYVIEKAGFSKYASKDALLNSVFQFEQATEFASFNCGIYNGDGSDLYRIRVGNGLYLGATKGNYVISDGAGDLVSATTLNTQDLWQVWKVTKVSGTDNQVMIQNLGNMYDWNSTNSYLCNRNMELDMTGFYDLTNQPDYFILTLTNVDVQMAEVQHTTLDGKTVVVTSLANGKNLSVDATKGLVALDKTDVFTLEHVTIDGEPDAYRIKLSNGKYLSYYDWADITAGDLIDDVSSAAGQGQLWVLLPVVGVDGGYTISPYFFGKENHGDGNVIYRMLFNDNGIHSGIDDGLVYSEFGKNELRNYLQRVWIFAEFAGLDAPVISAEGPRVSWDYVVGAAEYEIFSGETSLGKTSSNSFIVTGQAGTHTITVVAILGENKSSASNALSVVVAESLDIPQTSINGKVVSWDAIEDATGYEVYVNDELATTLGAEVCSYTITALGTVKVQIKAITTAENIENSLLSDEIVVSIADTSKPFMMGFELLNSDNRYLAVINESLEGARPMDNYVHGRYQINGEVPTGAIFQLEQATTWAGLSIANIYDGDGSDLFYIRTYSGKYLGAVKGNYIFNGGDDYVAESIFDQTNLWLVWKVTFIDTDTIRLQNLGAMFDWNNNLNTLCYRNLELAGEGAGFYGYNGSDSYFNLTIKNVNGVTMQPVQTTSYDGKIVAISNIKTEDYVSMEDSLMCLDGNLATAFKFEKVDVSGATDVYCIQLLDGTYLTYNSWGSFTGKAKEENNNAQLWKLRAVVGLKDCYTISCYNTAYDKYYGIDFQRMLQLEIDYRADILDYLLFDEYGSPEGRNNTQRLWKFTELVGAPTVEISGDYKSSYIEGESFDKTNLVVTLKYGALVVEAPAFMIVETPLVAGTTSVALSLRYFGAELTKDVTISVASLTSLDAPVIAQSNGTISWTAVVGATEYEVYNGETLLGKTSQTSYLVSGDAGVYNITVVATRGELRSEKSNAVELTLTSKLATPVVSVDGKVASWSAVSNATGYEIYLNDEVVESVGADVLTYTITELGQIKVQVKAVSTDVAWEASELSESVTVTLVDLTQPFNMGFADRLGTMKLGIVGGENAHPDIKISNFVSEKVELTDAVAQTNTIFALEPATAFASYKCTGIYEGDGSDLYYIRTYDGRYLGATKNNYVNSGWGDYVSASVFDDTNLWLVWKVTVVDADTIRLQNLGHNYDWNTANDYICNLNRDETGASTGFYALGADLTFFDLTVTNVAGVTMQPVQSTNLNGKTFTIKNLGANKDLTLNDNRELVIGDTAAQFTFEKVNIDGEPNAYRIKTADGKYIQYMNWGSMQANELIADHNDTYGRGQVFIVLPVIGVEDSYTICDWWEGKVNEGQNGDNAQYRKLYVSDGSKGGVDAGDVYCEQAWNAQRNNFYRLYTFTEVTPA